MTVRAAGTVLWRPSDIGIEVALVHRPKYDDWSLPKGKCDPGEHPAETAVRETTEETGFSGPLTRHLGQLCYDVRHGGDAMPKVVDYWAMPAFGGVFTPSAEVDEVAWLSPADALRRLTRPADRDPLDAFTGGPAVTVTVLLIRHGHAGERAGWKGPDADRPLDEQGTAQAARVAAVGGCFGVTSVQSADLRRCLQTVAPLAAAAGVAVEPRETCGEEFHADHPEAALEALRAVVRDGGHGAICSQGGVIPDTVTALTSGLPWAPERVRSRKGSMWVLSFDGEHLAGAHYLADLGAVT